MMDDGGYDGPIAIKNGHARPIFARSMELLNFQNMLFDKVWGTPLPL